MGEEHETITESATPGDGARGGLTPAMRRVLWVVGALVLAGLILAVWLSIASSGTGASGSAEPAADPAPTSTSTPPSTPGPVPGATPTTGSEVQPPEASAPPADRLPPVSAAAPLVKEPLPDPGSASGELVDGFPAEVMGPLPDASVVQSSIATEASTMQATLTARTDATPAEVTEYYRILWSGLGLADAGAGSGTDTSYSDAFSSVSLAFSSSGTGTVYTVYGVFRTS